MTLALAALALVHFREQPPVAELSRLQVSLPANESFTLGFAPQQVSPDGRKLAFVAAGFDGKPQLWIRFLDSLDARGLPGTETAPLSAPFFWSWDSRFIAFISSDRKLKKVDVSGGPAQTLCDAANLVGGSWNREGVILFGGGPGGGGVMRVSEAGGPATALTALDGTRREWAQMFPQLLPDGRHFLYFRRYNTPENTGIYVGSIDAEPFQQTSKPLLLNEAFPEYHVPSRNAGNGHLLFYREGTVMAQAFNPNGLELSGDAVPVAEHVGGYLSLIGFFSASNNAV